MTPFEALFGTKPDLSHLPEWGTKVWVHDPTKTKLDGQSNVGKWVGFDEPTHGHHIYWPEKRSVTVERSVKFDIGDVVFARNAPEPVITPPRPLQLPEPPQRDCDDDTEVNPTQEEAPAPTVERERRQRKPSEYVKRLQRGEGTIKGRQKGPNLPQGISEPTLPEAPSTEDEAEHANLGAVEYAMIAGVVETEGTDPTYHEARRRCSSLNGLAATASSQSSTSGGRIQ
jgi:hypothetical protein